MVVPFISYSGRISGSRGLENVTVLANYPWMQWRKCYMGSTHRNVNVLKHVLDFLPVGRIQNRGAVRVR